MRGGKIHNLGQKGSNIGHVAVDHTSDALTRPQCMIDISSQHMFQWGCMDVLICYGLVGHLALCTCGAKCGLRQHVAGDLKHCVSST